jgi:dihydroneopterin triphosphate diphosphatase
MRQPRQVIVFPFRMTEAGPEYAVFRRSDDGCWQGVEGGADARIRASDVCAAL